MKKNIVDLKKFKENQELKKQIQELDDLHDVYVTHEPDPIVRKGYKNFMKLLKILDEKYEKGEE